MTHYELHLTMEEYAALHQAIDKRGGIGLTRAETAYLNGCAMHEYLESLLTPDELREIYHRTCAVRVVPTVTQRVVKIEPEEE